MAEMTDAPVLETAPDTDLVSALVAVLESSAEPMTLAKIRAALPANLRAVSPERLLDILRRQAAANVFVEYPKYRSPHERFWDRPMDVHIACLLRAALEEKPLPWSDLRRKLPDYAKSQAQTILDQQIAEGRLHLHPPLKSRSGARFGASPADPREYLRGEFTSVFKKLSGLGFTHAELREGAIELLHEEEWASPPPAAEAAIEATDPQAGKAQALKAPAAAEQPSEQRSVEQQSSAQPENPVS